MKIPDVPREGSPGQDGEEGVSAETQDRATDRTHQAAGRNPAASLLKAGRRRAGQAGMYLDLT